MNRKSPERIRVLGIAPTNRGFGYFVMEGATEILAFGTKDIQGAKKNRQALVRVDKLIAQWQPQILSLQDVSGEDAKRAKRIKDLFADLAQTAESSGMKVSTFSGKQLRNKLLHDPRGTKYQMAVEIAKKFPEALAEQLPPKRRAWDSENRRMSIFEAAALVIAFWAKKR